MIILHNAVAHVTKWASIDAIVEDIEWREAPLSSYSYLFMLFSLGEKR